MPAMPGLSSPRWSGAEHTSLQRAFSDPEFQRRACELGMPRTRLENWLRLHEVPVSCRRELRALLCAWSSRAPAG